LSPRRTSSTALLLIMIFFISLLALTCASYNHNQLLKIPKVDIEKAMALSALSVFCGRGQGGVSTLLNQTTRVDIYSFVMDNPGVHFRALSNCLGMPIGVLQYHLGLLVNGGVLSTYQDGRYKRYFESKRFTETEMKIISMLRHETARKILTALLKKPQIVHKDLAAQLSISSQALSWQMRCLERKVFVKREAEAMSVKYSLDETIFVTVGRCATFVDAVTKSNLDH